MVFYEEQTGLRKDFNFSGFPVPVEMQRWMAQLLASRCGPRGGSKRTRTAQAYFDILKHFAAVLAKAEPVPSEPGELTAAHFQAFRKRYEEVPTVVRPYVLALRRMMQPREELAADARRELLRTRLPTGTPDGRIFTYSDSEWQQIMTALRHDVRTCRDRIREGLRLLAAFRSGGLEVGSQEESLGRLLDLFARTGDLPRRQGPSGKRYHTREVLRLGGARGISRMLCLTGNEATAFALLISALTAENFGTVKKWPAAHTRPDGGFGAPGIALIEESKPRRGPEHEHMVIALEDLPPSLREVLEAEKADSKLFRSPLRLYELLLELTQVARQLSGESAAFLSCSPSSRTRKVEWNPNLHSRNWGLSHGFSPSKDTESDKPAVDVRRIRQTALELQRRPVAHTARTLRDHYLRRSSTVQAQRRTLVGEALCEQIAKARAVAEVPVFTPAFLERAAADPTAAAAEAGLEAEVLKRMLTGEQDAVVTACTDHRDSPHSSPGQPCTASFLVCLNCKNARALPHHLPLQVAVHDRLLALRPNIDPNVWRVRYETTVHQLQDIIDHYTTAEQASARESLLPSQERLVGALITGRLDLR
ncbi:hypothetical protein [Streptomyces sp. MMG1522]|uniref:hypothetical protein n=3 Tax=Streptomyces TaxID=1883 RepID=UPI0006ADF318|nr:hypothetical protein [Streptomyces sp. MMG1522]